MMDVWRNLHGFFDKYVQPINSLTWFTFTDYFTRIWKIVMPFQIMNSLDYSKGSASRPRYKILYNRVMKFISRQIQIYFRKSLRTVFLLSIKKYLEVCSVKEK